MTAENVRFDFNKNPAREDDIYYKELIECIKKHQEAIKYKHFTPALKWAYIILIKLRVVTV